LNNGLSWHHSEPLPKPDSLKSNKCLVLVTQTNSSRSVAAYHRISMVQELERNSQLSKPVILIRLLQDVSRAEGLLLM
jgi:hypothetical protein